MERKHFYLGAAVLGTVIPWALFADFFTTHGVNLTLFVRNLFVNGAAGGFSADVLLSIVVFWVWSYVDSRQQHVRRWWLVLPSACLVGLPLYLYLREHKKDQPTLP